MPFDDTDSGKTHYYGCWKDPDHHECAVRFIERAVELIQLEALHITPNMAEWLRDVGATE